MLESNGHQVLRYARHNAELETMNPVKLAARTIWNRTAFREVSEIIHREKPDILHVTNSFPLLSPAILHAGHRQSVAVVQSLRNYRLICPAAILLREGKVCEACTGQSFAWSAVKHGCYRNSRSATFAIAAMNSLHRVWGTWDNVVDQYLTLTEFARSKFIESGIAAEKITVKPNTVQPDPGFESDKRQQAIFVGRLSPEKGLDVLLDAWKRLTVPVPLHIVGDGPLADQVRQACQQNPLITWHGALPFTETCQKIRESAFLVMPSVWYETFGRTTVEAFATGSPVIASRLGAMQELVTPNETGWLFEPGNAVELASLVERMHQSPEECRRMGLRARGIYETHYTPSPSYQALMTVYHRALTHRASRQHQTQTHSALAQA